MRDCGGILCCGSWVEASKSTHGEKKDFCDCCWVVCLWVAHGLLQLIDCLFVAVWEFVEKK